MVRYRWYLLLTKKDINYISQKIRSLLFDNGVRKGFKIDYISSNNISGVFYNISILHQENADIEIFNAIQFSILEIKGKIYLRIQDPTRSIKEFSSLLFEAFEFDLAFEPIVISFNDIEKWISYRKFEYKLNLIKISNLRITRDITSEMTFRSDNNLLLSEIDILKGKNFNVLSMSWIISESGKKCKISASKSGLVYISKYLVLDFLDYIESQLF